MCVLCCVHMSLCVSPCVSLRVYALLLIMQDPPNEAYSYVPLEQNMTTTSKYVRHLLIKGFWTTFSVVSRHPSMIMSCRCKPFNHLYYIRLRKLPRTKVWVIIKACQFKTHDNYYVWKFQSWYWGIADEALYLPKFFSVNLAVMGFCQSFFLPYSLPYLLD